MTTVKILLTCHCEILHSLDHLHLVNNLHHVESADKYTFLFQPSKERGRKPSEYALSQPSPQTLNNTNKN